MKDNERYAFLMVALGYWARGQTVAEASKNLVKEGCCKSERVQCTFFIGDDKPAVTAGGMVEFEHGAGRVSLGVQTLGRWLQMSK